MYGAKIYRGFFNTLLYGRNDAYVRLEIEGRYVDTTYVSNKTKPKWN